MSKASVSIAALEQMKAKMNKFKDAQNTIIGSLMRDYIAAGDEWDDAKYTELGTVLDGVINAMKRTEETINSANSKIDRLRGHVDDYNSTRF